MNYIDVIDFWFSELEPSQRWAKDQVLDQMIRDRFLDMHTQASLCLFYEWRLKPLGRLAEIIVLDQFSRNMFRGRPESFKFDSLALCLSQEAVLIGADQFLNQSERAFLYMPYMHSESHRIHKEALKLYRDLPENLEFEIKHKEIIDRFGRYPHRNEILGRPSTPEEIKFLKEPGSSF